MAITTKTITTTWQAITAAGQSGSCWIVEDDTLGAGVGQSDVFIYHSTVAPVGAAEILKSKRLYRPNSNKDTMSITADSGTDIFYAICKTTGSTVKINVDVV